MLRRLLIALFVAIAGAPVLAQQPMTAAATAPSLSQALPVDPKVRIGTLPNGLR